MFRPGGWLVPGTVRLPLLVSQVGVSLSSKPVWEQPGYQNCILKWSIRGTGRLEATPWEEGMWVVVKMKRRPSRTLPLIGVLGAKGDILVLWSSGE